MHHVALDRQVTRCQCDISGARRAISAQSVLAYRQLVCTVGGSLPEQHDPESDPDQERLRGSAASHRHVDRCRGCARAPRPRGRTAGAPPTTTSSTTVGVEATRNPCLTCLTCLTGAEKSPERLACATTSAVESTSSSMSSYRLAARDADPQPWAGVSHARRVVCNAPELGCLPLHRSTAVNGPPARLSSFACRSQVLGGASLVIAI